MIYFLINQKKRTGDNDDSCPMTPDQIEVMIANQQQLMKDMADIKKYMFAGRVVFGTLVVIGLTLDWTRDHINFIKIWINK